MHSHSDVGTPPPGALRLYGIPNCDTVRRARAWLDARGVPHRLVDLRREPLTAARAKQWLSGLPWDTILNRRGTTWRALPDAQKAAADALVEQGVAAAPDVAHLLTAHPGLMKRPLVEWPDGHVSVGFDPDTWKVQLGI